VIVSAMTTEIVNSRKSLIGNMKLKIKPVVKATAIKS
jgi:hypothetical protein